MACEDLIDEFLSQYRRRGDVILDPGIAHRIDFTACVFGLET